MGEKLSVYYKKDGRPDNVLVYLIFSHTLSSSLLEKTSRHAEYLLGYIKV